MITSYKDITVNKYLELQKLLEEDYDDLTVQVKMISILSGIDENSILHLPLAEYHRMVLGTAFLLEKPKLTKSIPNKITIDGKKFKVCKDIPSINVAQYVDYNNLTKMEDKDKYIPNILACFIVPDGHTYGDEKYKVDDVAELLGDHMCIEDALGVCFFFHKKYRRLIEDTLIYLEWKLRRMRRKTKDKEKITTAMNQIQELRSLLENGLG